LLPMPNMVSYALSVSRGSCEDGAPRSFSTDDGRSDELASFFKI